MVTGLDIRLSGIIGQGKNRTLEFEAGRDGSAVLYVLLRDQRLVEIPVRSEGNSIYRRIEGGQRITVTPQTGLVEVANLRGRRLAMQQYEPKGYQ